LRKLVREPFAFPDPYYEQAMPKLWDPKVASPDECTLDIVPEILYSTLNFSQLCPAPRHSQTPDILQ
jgi:hypothetical protein